MTSKTPAVRAPRTGWTRVQLNALRRAGFEAPPGTWTCSTTGLR